MVPDELAGEFDELHHLAIEFAHDLGAPLLGKERQLLTQVDLVHESPDRVRAVARFVRRLTIPRAIIDLRRNEDKPVDEGIGLGMGSQRG